MRFVENFNSLIVRYSEIGLKSSQVRREMEKRLIKNLEKAYRSEGVNFIQVLKRASRIVVYTSDPKVREVTKLVFGVKSYSPTLETEADIEELKKASLSIAAKERGSFAVRVRRITKNFPLTSIETARLVGSVIKEQIGRPVDLTNPNQEIFIELIGKKAYVTDEKISGYGGLPVGTQGQVLALISSGIDSPVAAWLIMRRGAQVIPVHFKKTDEEEEGFMRLVSVLKKFSYGANFKPIVVKHATALRKYLERGAREWICLLCKRRMLVLANKIANQLGASAIVTGDSLGQVASQTLENLEVETHCLEKPVLRPLIGMDKDDIVKMAKKIGTYDISIVYDVTCPFVPKKPKTKSRWDKFLKVARRVGADDLLDACKGA